MKTPPCPLRARWVGRTRGSTVTGGTAKVRADLGEALLKLAYRTHSQADSESSILVTHSAGRLSRGTPVLLAARWLGRDRRVQAKPLRGRFASLDTSATAKGGQLRGGQGRSRLRCPGGAGQSRDNVRASTRRRVGLVLAVPVACPIGR